MSLKNITSLSAQNTFVLNGFLGWKGDDRIEKAISIEETAVVNANGAEYLVDPKDWLILIKPQ